MINIILEQLAATDSTKAKQEILKHNENNETLQRIFYLTYCKQVTFGVKKYTMPLSYSGEITLEQALDVFVTSLTTRAVTGHAALELITATLARLTSENARIAALVLNRDLECGCSASTANKIWKDLIPQQPCMLATSYSDKAVSKIRLPAYAQLKSDGARGMADCDAGDIFTRAGNQYKGLTKLEAVLEKLAGRGLVVDGELVYMPTMTQTAPVTTFGTLDALFGDDVKEKKEAVVADRQTGNGIMNKAINGDIPQHEADNVVFTVWDVVDRDVYYGKKACKETYKERFERLRGIVEELNDPRVQLIENHVVNSLDEARAIYNMYIDQGLEGIILKDLGGLWENRRSKWQVKFKEVIDIDLEIVDYYVHEKDPNKLGGLTVRTACGRCQNNMGSGFTDTTHRKDKSGEKVYIPLSERDVLDRELLWSIRESLPGQIIKATCNGLLTSQSRKAGEAEFKLFLPIMECFRPDKTTANSVVDIWPNR